MQKGHVNFIIFDLCILCGQQKFLVHPNNFKYNSVHPILSTLYLSHCFFPHLQTIKPVFSVTHRPGNPKRKTHGCVSTQSPYCSSCCSSTRTSLISCPCAWTVTSCAPWSPHCFHTGTSQNPTLRWRLRWKTSRLVVYVKNRLFLYTCRNMYTSIQVVSTSLLTWYISTVLRAHSQLTKSIFECVKIL